nr:hypothetical protein [Tanacetum cinerariifolium]
MHEVHVQLVMGELRTKLEMKIQVKQDRLSATTAMENGVALDEEQLLFIKGGQDNSIYEDVDKKPVQDLALNVDNVFQADDCDAFDSDVDEAPTAQTMFMANLSSADLVYDEAGPSYDSNILSEVHGHDHYQDVVCEHHKVHEMHDYVQPNYVVNSHVDYTSDSNMIPYDQYVKDNAVLVVQNPVTDEVGPSYDSYILSEVPDHEHYQDAACAHHEGHVTYDSVQLDHVVDSHADYTSDSNMILYDQYVKDNEVPVVHSDASSVLTDAMMIYNDMCESHKQSISNPSRNTVVKNSLTAELATYKEHVELYEQHAKFELTE